MGKSNQITVLTLFFICFYLNVNAGIYFPTADSTDQKVIEFIHKKKDKEAHFFKRGDNVVVKIKGRFSPIRGKIEGFTKDGIVIQNKEIKIKDMKSIRGRSTIAFILSLFSSISTVAAIAGVLLLLAILATIGSVATGGLGALGALLLLYLFIVVIGGVLSLILILLGIALLFGLLSRMRKRTYKFFSLKRWRARIASRKIANLK